MDRYISQIPHIRLRLNHLRSTSPLFADLAQNPLVTAMMHAGAKVASSYGRPITILANLDLDLYKKEKAVWNFICKAPLFTIREKQAGANE